jgi:hypothetical protein
MMSVLLGSNAAGREVTMSSAWVYPFDSASASILFETQSNGAERPEIWPDDALNEWGSSFTNGPREV